MGVFYTNIVGVVIYNCSSGRYQSPVIGIIFCITPFFMRQRENILIQWFIREEVFWAAFQDFCNLIKKSDVIFMWFFNIFHIANKSPIHIYIISKRSLANLHFNSHFPYSINHKLVCFTNHNSFLYEIMTKGKINCLFFCRPISLYCICSYIFKLL